MARTVFITATDTDAGKTWVTARLLQDLQRRGLAAQALKPLASGVSDSGVNEDVQVLQALQPELDVSHINFRTFQTPVAPALAAWKEGKPWQPQQLLAWQQERIDAAPITLIEGVGGLMAPLLADERQTWLVSDWLQAMPDAEIMLVVPLRLGCMSQTLVHCACLAAMGRAPTWIVLNDVCGQDTCAETKRVLLPRFISMFSRTPELVCVGRDTDLPSIL